MAIDSVSSSTAAPMLQTPLRPRADETLRTAPATAERANNESPEALRSGGAQGAAQSQLASEAQRAAKRPTEVSAAASAADQARQTLNAAGQTVGRIVDTTA